MHTYDVIDPIKFFFSKYGFRIEEIEKIASGQIYTAVMIKNGNIGVCSNLNHCLSIKKEELKKPDLENLNHRIILNAYFNARFNYNSEVKNGGDIFDIIDFSKYRGTTMLGLFKPIVGKFKKQKLPLVIFDLMENSTELTPLDRKDECLMKTDAVILSSTTIFNKTFIDEISKTKDDCDIFLLGPSSLMNPDMLIYRNIKMICGSVFEKFDERVLSLIENGYGTRTFLKHGKKVFLK